MDYIRPSRGRRCGSGAALKSTPDEDAPSEPELLEPFECCFMLFLERLEPPLELDMGLELPEPVPDEEEPPWLA